MDENVITSSDIQVKYQKLYNFLMQYLWEFNVVEDLANLEIACYQRFPDQDEMLKCLKKLNNRIKSTYSELSEDDEPEFEAAYDALESAIENYDSENASVDVFVASPPVEAMELLDAPEDKKKFKIGDIEKKDESKETEDESEENEPESKDRIVNPFEEEEE